jgi:predicted nucleotidyltransferase
MRESASRSSMLRIEPEEEVRNVARDWLDRVKPALGSEFVCAYLVGSCLRQGFDLRRSDLSLLVIARSLSRPRLQELAEALAQWRRPPRVSPIFHTQEQLRRSLDVSPIEILDLEETHLLLEGPDVLGGLAIPREFLRLQCEREVRRHFLDLRQTYLLHRRSPSILARALDSASSQLGGLFRTLLRLRGEEVPAQDGRVIELVSEVYALDAQKLLGPYVLRDSSVGMDRVRQCYLDFVLELERLTGTLDELRIA